VGESILEEPNFFGKIITVEIRVFQYDPETKLQSLRAMTEKSANVKIRGQNMLI
jgi:hypothetical protein